MDGIFAGLENSKMDPRERLVGKRDRRLVDTQKRIQASRRLVDKKDPRGLQDKNHSGWIFS